MLQQHQALQGPYALIEPNAQLLCGLAYRSVAVSEPTESEFHELLRSAQKRNEAEGVSGVLLYSNGAYFQWLEGPSAAVRRVWESISHDSRHRQIIVLRDEPLSQRVFEGWNLRIARGPDVSIDAAVAALYSPSTQLLKHVMSGPTSLLEMTWEDVIATAVIPHLLQRHAGSSQGVRRQSTATIWHASADSGAELAGALLAHRSGATARYVDSLIEQGAGLNALYHEVFEPAQLHLGKLWDAQRCDDFRLSIGLARLHVEVRRVNAAVTSEHSCVPNQSVLLCLQPEETHLTSLVMSSELFSRSGWDVTSDPASNEQALLRLLHDQWFDVLKLSQSGALRRDSWLNAMRDTIDAARGCSLNPALLVIVDGRTFTERPEVYRAVHAHAGSASVLDAVPLASRMLGATRTQSSEVSLS